MVAGHSVGEITAAAATGVLTPQDAMSLVSLRGRAMAEASAITPTGMSAVLGGDPAEVAAALDRHGLTPANMNGAGQVVAAGTLEQLAALRGGPAGQGPRHPAPGRRRVPHRPHGPRRRALSGRGADHDVSDPGVTLLSNADGVAVATGAEFLGRLISQVRNPVRWDLCMETMTELGVTGLVELAPAGTLVGLAKRAMKGVPTVALKTPDDLDAARELLAASTSAKA